ncbi:uncharacterized protein LOC129924769 [Biomphalaria glabrata]|uniref:Uncharacterized protein LOC129924769 n=1 Tax=Biomphalaria glabrata TaxID=6526 RepID=A0A9W2ZRD6_BIOGL|nr:uncharacterized protein LOC129924769 [Biomphalaria glabrata]
MYADSKYSDDQIYYKEFYIGSQETVIRSTKCEVLTKQTSTGFICKNCNYAKRLLNNKLLRAKSRDSKPLSKQDPLHKATREKIISQLKNARMETNYCQQQLKQFQSTLMTDSVELSYHLSQDLKNVIEHTDNELAKLFWEEQMKAFSIKEKGMRWHPMLIRLAILIRSRSPLAYDTLRKTGILKLPGASTLRDYTNVYESKEGFNESSIEELKRISQNFKSEEKCVILLHDEMMIKYDLVFNKTNGEVVGFVNSHTWNEKLEKNIASHVLVFFVVGINTHINISLGFFGSINIASGDLFPLFWQAVGYLETDCSLKVIASTSDKASSNQKMYQMHKIDDNDEICFKCVNLFSPDRFIFFISDPPHLIKTVRNNILNSGYGQTHLLWNNGKEILWKHIFDVYNIDCQTETRQTKLTAEHVNLNNISKMNVRLAAQVLSFSVGTMMGARLGPEAEETTKLILLMNRFFDCLNVSSLLGGTYKCNSDLLPYTSLNDERFSFLENEVLGYFKEWKMNIEKRPGYFTNVQKSKMFISHQTFKGLEMTVKGFCGATRYLLSHGVPSVLSNNFCQDPLEEHFGRHRGLGQRSENPTLYAFGYQENKLRIQRSLALQLHPKGNIRRQNEIPVSINTSPLKKLKRV